MHCFFDLFSNFHLLFSALIRCFLHFYVWILGEVKQITKKGDGIPPSLSFSECSKRLKSNK